VLRNHVCAQRGSTYLNKTIMLAHEEYLVAPHTYVVCDFIELHSWEIVHRVHAANDAEAGIKILRRCAHSCSGTYVRLMCIRCSTLKYAEEGCMAPCAERRLPAIPQGCRLCGLIQEQPAQSANKMRMIP